MNRVTLPFGRAGIVGLGRSGASAARLLAGSGIEVRVTEARDTPDLAGVAAELATLGVLTELGGQGEGIAAWAEALVVSPGVPPANPVITAAVQRGIPVWSEIELAWRFASVPVLAVTGTNGKTTTTTLLASVLQAAGLDAVAAGNIGYPLVDAVEGSHDVIVCEVSSFQLAFAETFRPSIAIVLNVADDHYDWHAGYDDYLSAKARIGRVQTAEDLLIAGSADRGALRIAAGAPARPAAFGLGDLASVHAAARHLGGRPLAAAAGVEGGRVVAEGSAGPASIVEVEKIRLVGPHNLENVLAASLAALEWGVEPEVIGASVAAFSPLAHRSTLIGEIDGVRYIDDSKATNPHATLSALRGLQRVVLIAGGRPKGLDLSPLAEHTHRLAGVVAMGEATAELQRLFAGRVRFGTAAFVEEAVETAAGWAAAGDTVLLSPACSSLDQYASYVERGDRFAAAVGRLARAGVR
ncbi:MAG TPA: UDP-N-acetylmuramoyl-L-alanine--D-glutamate ligase [Actinomycetota bacterium]|nr:UDP-N-acetylmuramoyl-L-alanine--D-glutamate ligase [Actinomycetota bacterium]